METNAVIKALVQRETEYNFPDTLDRVLIAAAKEIIKRLAAENKCPEFDFQSETDKAFLIKAVSRTNPEALTGDDWKVLELLQYASN